MKRLLSLIVLAIILSSTLTFAAEKSAPPKDRGREIIKFNMGVVELGFQHWKHQKGVHNDCSSCHKNKIGVIEGWGKDVAHNICIPCHDLENKGPVLCHECHNK